MLWEGTGTDEEDTQVGFLLLFSFYQGQGDLNFPLCENPAEIIFLMLNLIDIKMFQIGPNR